MISLLSTIHCALTISVIILFVFCGDAHAYIDPGSGSHLFQMLIAGLLAAFYGIKVYWLKITSYFQKLFKRPGR